MTDTERDLSTDDLERERAAALPDREAMSLISTDPTQADAYGSMAGDLEAAQQAQGAADGAATGAHEAASGTDAQGSASGGESATAEDRSETISASDTASAG